MSPASKSKSKEKKASKEQQKPTPKPAGPAAGGGTSVPASAYNPLSGTFHALESTVSVAPPLHSNGRFKNIDDTDAQSGVLLSSVAEYDTVSNNGSWSGESEDHKDKKSNATARQETIPGADIDKREKIRQKNEKKHQRQKERRAQELHERCSGYLMSRKLEALAQQLVAMGFSHDRATLALILNEGKLEESVSWLFEGVEEPNDSENQNIGGQNLKLDISEELARISDLESQYKCTKQEVERAIVACEGDLEKAAESLRELKLDPPAASPKPEETGDPPTALSNKFPGNTSQAIRPQAKPNPSSIQQRKDEKDFNYTKGAITAGTSIETIGKNIPQPLRRTQPKMEWGNYEQITAAEKRWPSTGTSPISFSLASASTQLSSPPIKNEPRYFTVGTEFNSLQSGPAREPTSVVQGRNPSLHTKQASVGTISSSPPGGWYSTNGIANIKSPSGGFLPQMRNARSFKPSDVTLSQMYPQVQFQQQQQQQQHFAPGNSRGDFLEPTYTNASWSRTGSSTSIAAASSLGLFSGASSTQSGASSPVDWSTGNSMPHLDYSDIDWSVDRGLSSVRPSGLLQGLNSYMQKNGHLYELSNAQPFVPAAASNFNNRVSIAGLQNGGVASETSGNGSREWSSPFEGKDIFSFPRQFVFSPP
ncbi:stress response protein NST1 [Momordica charantia]|uniref:Stress response protein NST1 n=1 Tax=Momordica charantia TaxID=3673 RepID=A0A6J1D1Z2_MOMCH|nr:stress response protein NST1 [Momordica charantia]